jgi:hypothetical protein
MTEDQNETNNEAPAEEKSAGHQVFEEFQSLGSELALAFKAMWEHDDSRKLRQELRTGFSELGRQVDSAMQTAQESETAQQFGEQVKDTVDKARESDLAAKMEEGVLTGLRELNTEISKFVSSIDTSGQAGQGSDAEATEPEAGESSSAEARSDSDA